MVLQFILASIVINLIPGSDRLFIVATALRGGINKSCYALIGISSAILIHSIFGAFGIAVLVQANQKILIGLRWAGILFLFFLSIQSYLETENNQDIKYASWISSTKGFFFQGFLVHFLNPIAIIFSFTFIPQFILPNENFQQQFLTLALISNLLSFMVNFAVIFLVHFLQRKLSLHGNTTRTISSLILFLVGLALLINIFKDLI